MRAILEEKRSIVNSPGGIWRAPPVLPNAPSGFFVLIFQGGVD
jgi:hypothetical protein